MEVAAADAHCHMDDLPDEVFAKILNLAPIMHVIRCATVSKRWDAACRYLIRTRESLVIGYDEWYDGLTGQSDWDRKQPSHRMDGIILNNKSLISETMIGLNQMVELKRLRVLPRGLSPFIGKFAEQLTMLEMGFAVSMISAVVFPHLTRLRCRHFDAHSAATFIKLAELSIYGLKNEEKLPNMRLPSLKKLLIVSFMHDAVLVREFILANADSLTHLEMSGTPLRSDHALVFPNLLKVEEATRMTHSASLTTCIIWKK